MDEKQLIAKIMEKPELKQLPEEDVRLALGHFMRRQTSEEEKIRLTRDLLHRAYGAFGSRKLFTLKEREAEEVLKKHLSTRERFPFYEEIYSRILGKFRGSVFDFGAGVNGFSVEYLRKTKYIAVEGVGQFVDLMNHYFKTNKLPARAIHLSLFDLEKIKKILHAEKGPKAVFIFKVLDSLEMLKRDYSKEFLKGITSEVDRVTVSVATRSMVRRTRFNVDRSWLVRFITENFNLIDDFELGGERYITFSRK